VSRSSSRECSWVIRRTKVTKKKKKTTTKKKTFLRDNHQLTSLKKTQTRYDSGVFLDVSEASEHGRPVSFVREDLRATQGDDEQPHWGQLRVVQVTEYNRRDYGFQSRRLRGRRRFGTAATTVSQGELERTKAITHGTTESRLVTMSSYTICVIQSIHSIDWKLSIKSTGVVAFLLFWLEYGKSDFESNRKMIGRVLTWCTSELPEEVSE